MQSVIFMASGSIKMVDPANGKDFSLEELNEIVDGYIEILHIGDKLLVCNEEGKLQNLQYNATATCLRIEMV